MQIPGVLRKVDNEISDNLSRALKALAKEMECSCSGPLLS